MKLGMEGGETQAQPLSRGLSGIFRRKSKGGSGMGPLEAEGDALDAFSSGGPLLAAARLPSHSGRAWGSILGRRPSGEAAGEAASMQHAQQHPHLHPQQSYQQQQQHYNQQAEAELAALRARCEAQAQEAASLAAQLAAARAGEAAALEQLNLQRFKYDLLVDLWAVRVLDNEELGAQQPQHTAVGQ
ncbi:hypothetical protein ABPG75_014038 [Micractinium tetrahymenae]